MSLLDRIDNVIAGDLCPCGAEPREGSAYCSEDCTPTHHGVHTISHVDGTQMRWRPDLVSAVNDSDLRLIGRRQRGRFTASLSNRLGGNLVHLRLDDGYRFAGCDVDTSIASGYDGTPLWEHPKWAELERELTDSRRVDPDPWDAAGDPWEHVMHRYASLIDNFVFGTAQSSASGGETVTIQFDNTSGTLIPDEPVVMLPDGDDLIAGLTEAESEAALQQRARLLAEASTPYIRMSPLYRWQWYPMVVPETEWRNLIRITGV